MDSLLRCGPHQAGSPPRPKSAGGAELGGGTAAAWLEQNVSSPSAPNTDTEEDEVEGDRVEEGMVVLCSDVKVGVGEEGMDLCRRDREVGEGGIHRHLVVALGAVKGDGTLVTPVEENM